MIDFGLTGLCVVQAVITFMAVAVFAVSHSRLNQSLLFDPDRSLIFLVCIMITWLLGSLSFAGPFERVIVMYLPIMWVRTTIFIVSDCLMLLAAVELWRASRNIRSLSTSRRSIFISLGVLTVQVIVYMFVYFLRDSVWMKYNFWIIPTILLTIGAGCIFLWAMLRSFEAYGFNEGAFGYILDGFVNGVCV